MRMWIGSCVSSVIRNGSVVLGWFGAMIFGPSGSGMCHCMFSWNSSRA